MTGDPMARADTARRSPLHFLTAAQLSFSREGIDRLEAYKLCARQEGL